MTGSTIDPGAAAAADVAAYRRDPANLAALPLGRFSEAGVRSLLLRRLLLRLPLPVLILFGRAVKWAGPKAAGWLAEVQYWRTAKARLGREEWRRLTHGPVILMYHSIGPAGSRASRYVMPTATFQRQMGWLRARGYRFTTVRELAEARNERRLPPAGSVAVTFDDGYRDNLAALARTPIPATVFVVTGSIGDRNCWDAGGELRSRPLLTWEEARALTAAGVEIGAHTRSHPALPDVAPKRLAEEVAGSLADLQRELGPAARTFAYPHGRFDDAVQAAVAGAGFSAAACSRGGINDPAVTRWALRRVEVKGTDSFASFVLMVWLGRRITPLQLLRSLVLG